MSSDHKPVVMRPIKIHPARIVKLGEELGITDAADGELGEVIGLIPVFRFFRDAEEFSIDQNGDEWEIRWVNLPD